MTFYFPIKINDRRIHYFHLRDNKDFPPIPVYSFLVKNHDSPLLLSVNFTSPQLISDAGRKSNVKLADYSFRVETDEKDDIYYIHLCKGIQKTKNNAGSLVVDNVKLSSGKATVKYKTSHSDATHRDITLILCFEQNGTVYQDAIKIHLYRGDVLKSYALDFGSEASQIGGEGLNNYVNIIDKLLTFQSEGKELKGPYWQTDKDSHLYKSIFFINHEPKDTHFADKPDFDENAFVWPLMPRNQVIGNTLELLPNLKLIEIGQGAFQFSGEFHFTAETEIDDNHRHTLGDPGLRASVLRLILSNFLHCILKDVSNLDGQVCLRLVLMVPNVYHQSQIDRIVKGLYKDYYTIKQKDYPNCKGIEIQVVSESDASFVGIRTHSGKQSKDASQGYFLIIDAGKGTTDFSILQQQENLTKFNSCFRDGIPASGNVLTYAFFEALHNFFVKHGISNLNECIRRAQKSELLNFIDLLELFKVRYSDLSSDIGSILPNKTDLYVNSQLSLGNVNKYLNKLLNNNKIIPNSQHFVDAKINMLVNGLMLSMPSFISEKGIQFKQVVLAGRSFLFKPFKDAVVNSLLEKGWIPSEADILFFPDNRAKSLCIPGALAIETTCSVNENSGLIGNPSIGRVRDEGGASLLERIMNIILNRFSKPSVSSPDMKFFYMGTEGVALQNLQIQIGGRSYRMGMDNREMTSLFYIGNGFLCQQNEKSVLIAEKTYFKDDPIERDSIDEGSITYSPNLFGETDLITVIKQSLFPNHPNTIPSDDKMPVLKGKAPNLTKTDDKGKNTPLSNDDMNQ